MNNPAEKQIREFWEWCGFYYKRVPYRNSYHYEWRIDTDPNYKFMAYPTIDLDNLFKYAVPKLRDLSEDNALQDIEFHWQGKNISDIVECNLIFDEAQFNGEDKDPALALFWALWQVKETK